MYLVGGLDEEGLRSAVEAPARQAGLLIEPGLVDLLVGEVRNDPGALPLMSHALQETWKRREGSTLARLAHPNIGRLIDAGISESGHAYLVLEYVDGIRLDVFCDQHRLTPPRRLALFQQLLAAVAHAH